MAEKFGGSSKALHWTVSVLVLLMLYGGATLSRETATWHFGFGIITLIVMVFWLGHRMTHPRPAPDPTDDFRIRTWTRRLPSTACGHRD